MMRQRDYPRSVVIGPKKTVWTIRWVRPSDDRPWHGLADNTSKVVYIEMGQSVEQRRETFVHELCHAFAWELGIPWLHHHRYIKKLEKMIPAFLVNNGYLPRSLRRAGPAPKARR